jgi:hypothetical protein
MTNSEVMGNERRGFDLTDLGKSRTSVVGAYHGGAEPLVDAEARGVEFPLAPFKRFTEVCIAAMSDLTFEQRSRGWQKTSLKPDGDPDGL